MKVPNTPTPLIDSNADLRQYTIRAISLSNPRISPARKKLYTQLLIDVATKVFDSRDQQKFWIALIGVESRYEGAARSHTGAIGLGQLIPSYRADFGKDCGYTKVAVADLQDDYTNVTLSACYFRSLIQANDGSVPLALASYNQGQHSKDLASLKHGSAPGREAAAYVTKVWVKKNSTEKNR